LPPATVSGWFGSSPGTAVSATTSDAATRKIISRVRSPRERTSTNGAKNAIIVNVWKRSALSRPRSGAGDQITLRPTRAAMPSARSVA
jgi:hypothetical protein